MTTGPNRRVLCVDDEQRVLDGLERTLFDQFEISTETSPVRALAILEREPAFAVVLSDMRMPELDGAAFLARARAVAPLTSRMLLTGQAEVEAAVAAVNQGQILRFLCKPCPPDLLIGALELGVEQYRLLNAERELLERTVTGCVRLLTEILSVVAPGWFSRTQHIKSLVTHISEKLSLPEAWRYELASLFSLIGCVGLPEATLERVLANRPLDANEQKAFDEHPQIAHRLLGDIPRFEEIAEMVRLQTSASGPIDTDVQRGAAMLRIAFQVEARLAQGKALSDAITELSHRLHPTEQTLLKALSDYRSVQGATSVREVKVNQMTVQMELDEDVRTTNGVVVLPKGRELSLVLIERLLRFSRAGTLVEPVRVRVPG